MMFGWRRRRRAGVSRRPHAERAGSPEGLRYECRGQDVRL